jgi:hypothetical protein
VPCHWRHDKRFECYTILNAVTTAIESAHAACNMIIKWDMRVLGQKHIITKYLNMPFLIEAVHQLKLKFQNKCGLILSFWSISAMLLRVILRVYEYNLLLIFEKY